MDDWKKFKDVTTYDLIKTFQDRNQPDNTRDLVFFALCYKFREDLLNKCEINCKRFGHDINVAEQIAESTFKRYALKGDFKIEKTNTFIIDDSFKFYLYGIAKNELTNYYRLQQRKINGHLYGGSEAIIKDLPPLPNIKLSIQDQIKLKAIESLSPSHRAVYLTYKQHERMGCNLPKKLLEELREFLGGVKQSTIRGYKKEANDQIKKYLEVMTLTKELSDGKF
ncbi:DNA-directed RNA polymerase specialized sigma24 family protein [Arenibacter algicola]|uniref:DNA-directed RNA polymerase specialized sigma24 family protein n=1 Tax=Arenibacter algicola TaxID=616991 RepID=A0ABY3A821_9FLAO